MPPQNAQQCRVVCQLYARVLTNRNMTRLQPYIKDKLPERTGDNPGLVHAIMAAVPNKLALKEFVCPRSIKCIEENTFYDFGALQSILLNDGITEISGKRSYGRGYAYGALSRTGLRKLAIPGTVEKIGAHAFSCN